MIVYLRYKEVDDILNIENYLTRFFLIQDRLNDAHETVQAFESEAGENVPEGHAFTSLSQAQAWHARVKAYVQNLRADLTADSVLAPGSNAARWLLYKPAIISTSTADGTITCRLCRRCRAALANTKGKLNTPNPKMGSEMRANGLWRGPDPPEIAALSYNEAKVINLARIYVAALGVFSFFPLSLSL